MYAVYLDKKLMLVGDHPIDREEIDKIRDDSAALTIVENIDANMYITWDTIFKPRLFQDALMADRRKGGIKELSEKHTKHLTILLSWLVRTNTYFNTLQSNNFTIQEIDAAAYVQWFNVNYQLLVLVDDEEFSVLRSTLYEENTRWQNFFETIPELNNEQKE